LNEIVNNTFTKEQIENDVETIITMCYHCFRKYTVPFQLKRSKSNCGALTLYFYCFCAYKRRNKTSTSPRNENDETICQQERNTCCPAHFTIKMMENTNSIIDKPLFQHNHDASVGHFDNAFRIHIFSRYENRTIRNQLTTDGTYSVFKQFKDDGINREKIRNVIKTERIIMRKEDNILCTQPIVEDDVFIRVTNLTSDGKLDNFIVVNKETCQYKCNHYHYYIDDTVGIDINNTVFVCISTLSSNNKAIILAFGIIKDKKTESFRKFFSKYKEIVPVDPVVINVDRCEAQKNALLATYPNTHLVYCKVHIRRNSIQNFSDTIIVSLFDERTIT